MTTENPTHRCNNCGAFLDREDHMAECPGRKTELSNSRSPHDHYIIGRRDPDKRYNFLLAVADCPDCGGTGRLEHEIYPGIIASSSPSLCHCVRTVPGCFTDLPDVN